VCCIAGLAVLLGAVTAVAGNAARPQEEYIAYTEPLPPVHYLENGQVVGIATEVVAAVFEKAGFGVRFRIHPWTKSYQLVQQDSRGFIFTINRTPERENLFYWIGPILSKRTSLYRLRKRQDVQVERPEDLKRYKIAVILGHSLTRWLEQQGLRPGKELVVTPNKDVEMGVFLDGKADLITGNQYTMYRALQQRGLDMETVEEAFFVNAKGYYLAANLAVPPSVIARLIAANIEVQQSGLPERLIRKYLY